MKVNPRPSRPLSSQNSDAKTRLFQKKYSRLFRAGDTVLDVGCGSGVFLELLRDQQILPVGVDLSREALTACQEKGFEIYNRDAFSFLAVSSSRFNGVFASHFIEHFSPPEVLRFFELCFEALAAGGLLAIVTPNTADLRVMTEWFWLDPTHVRPYPLELVKSLLNQAGFTVEAAGEDRQSVSVRGLKHRAVDTMRRITTLGLAGRGDTFVAGRKAEA